MIIEAIVISVVIGYIRKGRLANFASIEVKGFLLIFLSSFIQFLIFRLSDENGNALQVILAEQFYFLHILSYMFLLLVLGLNMNMNSVRFIFTGTLLNAIVIMVNAGQMPVKLPVDYQAVFDKGHVLLTESTKLKFLADIIILDRPYPIPKILSIGDVFLVIGVFTFIQFWMCKHPQIEQKEYSQIETTDNL